MYIVFDYFVFYEYAKYYLTISVVLIIGPLEKAVPTYR